MRRLLSCILCLIPSTALLAVDDDWDMNNQFRPYGEFLLWARELGPHSTLAVDAANKRVLTPMKVSKKFHYEPGFALGVKYQPSELRIFDFRFMMFKAWNALRSVAEPGALNYPFSRRNFANDWEHADEAEGKWRSQLVSAEIGYYHYIAPRKENYFGFAWQVVPRYFYIPEKFNLYYTKGSNISKYHLSTNNNLWGVQLGALVEYNPVSSLYWEFGTKVGVYANSACQSQHMYDNNNTTTIYDNDASGWQCAMNFQADLRIVYQIRSMFSAYLGYNFLYIWGIASAPGETRQIAVSDPSGIIRMKDDVQYYGGYLGFSLGF